MPPPSEEVLLQYEGLDGPAQSVIDTAVCVATQEQAEELATTFVGERQGYTNSTKYPTKTGVVADLSVYYNLCPPIVKYDSILRCASANAH